MIDYIIALGIAYLIFEVEGIPAKFMAGSIVSFVITDILVKTWR